MATTLLTHGVGAIKDTNSRLRIMNQGGGSLVKMGDENEKSGWFHFTLPKPSVTNPILKKVKVNFSTSAATVKGVKVYVGRNEVFSIESLDETSSFERPIDPGTEATNDQGIVLSIELELENFRSHVIVDSVGIEV
jgi:hypothetical protein